MSQPRQYLYWLHSCSEEAQRVFRPCTGYVATKLLASTRATPSTLGSGVYTLSQGLAIPYNARARNVRAHPRARARGMNPKVKAE